MLAVFSELTVEESKAASKLADRDPRKPLQIFFLAACPQSIQELRMSSCSPRREHPQQEAVRHRQLESERRGAEKRTRVMGETATNTMVPPSIAEGPGLQLGHIKPTASHHLTDLVAVWPYLLQISEKQAKTSIRVS